MDTRRRLWRSPKAAMPILIRGEHLVIELLLHIFCNRSGPIQVLSSATSPIYDLKAVVALPQSFRWWVRLMVDGYTTEKGWSLNKAAFKWRMTAWIWKDLIKRESQGRVGAHPPKDWLRRTAAVKWGRGGGGADIVRRRRCASSVFNTTRGDE